MRIKKLDHYNIVCTKERIESVINFYINFLGFEEGPRPDFSIEGAWLYREGNPLIHLYIDDIKDSSDPDLYDTLTGAVHHIAFDCDGYEEFRSKLDDHGIEYYRTIVPGTTIQQLFFHDPAGIRLELNFKNG